MTLFVTEFRSVRNARAGLEPAASVPPVAEQTVATAAGSAQSTLFNVATDLVRVHALANCCISFGTNPTATVTNMRMAAGATEYFSVPLNGGLRVAVIASS